MLKAAESQYSDVRLRWVKLKVCPRTRLKNAIVTERRMPQRDYIPGMGDCLDLAVIGMGWDRDRARELRGGSGQDVNLLAAH